MPRSRRVLPPLIGALSLFVFTQVIPGAAEAREIETELGPLELREVADGFENPWAIDILPGGDIVVTEIGGHLWRIGPDGTRQEISGVPEVVVAGQGGLLDIMVSRDFAESRELFLSFSKAQPSGAGTALAAGRLSADGTALEDVRLLFEMTPGGNRGQHFGSRIVEAEDGHLFLTIGERGEGALAQDLSRHNGKVIRLNRDGSVPEDNPFVGIDGAQPEIWSYGHRNPQGAGLDASGQLWVVEHGARGGDEINRIEPGANHGWPVISYGTNYNGSKIGEGTEKDGMVQPAFYWDPSIAPSGFAVGTEGPLAGRFVIGSLKFDALSIVDPETWQEVRIRTQETDRVRDVIAGPDGEIWFLSEPRGTIYGLAPVAE